MVVDKTIAKGLHKVVNEASENRWQDDLKVKEHQHQKQ